MDTSTEDRLTDIEANEAEFVATIRAMERTIYEQAKLSVELLNSLHLVMQTVVMLIEEKSIIDSENKQTPEVTH